MIRKHIYHTPLRNQVCYEVRFCYCRGERTTLSLTTYLCWTFVGCTYFLSSAFGLEEAKHPSYLESLLHYCLQTPSHPKLLREVRNGCCGKDFVKVPSNCLVPGIWWTAKAPSTTLFMIIVKVCIKCFTWLGRVRFAVK